MTIVSHRYGFAFIKTHKTAGTSIEVDLSQRVEDTAVVTPIKPEAPGHVARNHLDDAGKPLYWNHMTAAQLQDVVGRQTFRKLFVFCVEREPVAKCLSHWRMLKHPDAPGTLSPEEKAALSWERYLETCKLPVDDWRYTDPKNPGRLMVDKVLAYEELGTALPHLLARLGIADFKLQTRAKSEYSRSAQAEPDPVTPEHRRMIYEQFGPALKITGFDQRWKP